jgi:hypothetical protein
MKKVVRKITGQAGTLLLALTIVASLAGVVAAHGGDTDVIHSCVKKDEIRIVGAGETCKDKETALDWNKTGPVGPAGDDGEDGEDGAPGADGEDGAPGADGEDGAPGADGEDGAPGADGEDGAPGADGTNGAKGDKGDKGDKGEPGASGTSGYHEHSACLNNEKIQVIGHPSTVTECKDTNWITVVILVKNH